VTSSDAAAVALDEALDRPLVIADRRLASAPGLTWPVVLLPASRQAGGPRPPRPPRYSRRLTVKRVP